MGEANPQDHQYIPCLSAIINHRQDCGKAGWSTKQQRRIHKSGSLKKLGDFWESNMRPTFCSDLNLLTMASKAEGWTDPLPICKCPEGSYKPELGYHVRALHSEGVLCFQEESGAMCGGQWWLFWENKMNNFL
ncbi:unnamed protein product [Lepeophtheirus salmonis]|uniref:(salmon louse) hypothetical protein n=1 Tax=Lepeophtheirus salmonis TaxID=72036 RepID=A0A7R8CTC7_LEPSM|nr:unnamed protein product [Lepeophtheirus salmonis]CAF2925409.1 unnamed protein product [Lepeophtheirus salmonis]